MALNLTKKQQLFVDSYSLSGDKVAAVIYAGYTQERRKALSLSWQLLHNRKVIAEITKNKLKLKKDKEIEPTREFSKQDFINYALEDYKLLEITEPNRPRFLELAGKGAGILGNNEPKPNQTLNLTQININGKESPDELWIATRKLLGNDG